MLLAGMLSPALWSKLVLDLILVIIDQTSDIETLKSWCEAARGCRSIYHAAMAARWRTATFNDRDLLLAEGEDEMTFNSVRRYLCRHNVGQDWKPAGQMLKVLLERRGQSHHPAYYVRHLLFDFQMLKCSEDGIIDLDTNGYNLMPTIKSLRHSLSMLKGRFKDLHQVSCHGDVHPALLEFIISEGSKIRTLELRNPASRGYLQTSAGDEPHPQTSTDARWPLRFSVLSALQQLRDLNIHCLSTYETLMKLP